VLSDEEARRVEEEARSYPSRAAAMSEALMIAQEARGWVDDEALADVARALGASPASAEGIATFYELILRRPVGRHLILVCDSVCCWIRGRGLIEALEAKLGIALGGTTEDGQFTLLPAGCLGLCEVAPAMLIDGAVYGELTAEKLCDIIDEISGRADGDAADR
jgi:NADH-quinone oxidoreductase subunit E